MDATATLVGPVGSGATAVQGLAIQSDLGGTPAVSLPAGLSPEGLPVGVQLSGAYGDERTLLELAFLLESARPFARIQEVASACRA